MQNVIYKDDKEYPKLLKKISKGMPKQLYYKGSWKGSSASNGSQASKRASKQSIFDNCLAVVGSRKLTSYGKQAGEQIISQIAAAGVTIVSGFMSGGDALAHQAAVRVGGRTIAVMPCGIDLIHPQDQKELYQDILDNKGLIISEYEGDMQPKLWTYPQRNRIVAGLSQAILVIEAGEKSGTLITANYAKKFKRKIFALPGPITSSVSKGTNMLIKQGAGMVTEAGDVLGYFGRVRNSVSNRIVRLVRHRVPNTGSRASKHETQILELLEREALGIDELSRYLGISSSDLGVKLSLMEMQGVIKLRGDKYYAN